jgi:hypothetical protein
VGHPASNGRSIEAGTGRIRLLSFTANLIILALTMAASFAFTLVMNRLWPVSRRYTENDLVSWQGWVHVSDYAFRRAIDTMREIP